LRYPDAPVFVTFHAYAELNGIPATRFALTTKARPAIGLGKDLQGRRFIIVPGAVQTVGLVWL
jgi:hypothetical protein